MDYDGLFASWMTWGASLSTWSELWYAMLNHEEQAVVVVVIATLPSGSPFVRRLQIYCDDEEENKTVKGTTAVV